MNLFNKVSTQEKVDLVRNLSLLIKSGTPIDQAFGVLSDQSGPVLNKMLTEGKKKIEKGVSLSEIFEKNHNFDKIFVSFISAGEGSGTLGENLDFLINWLEGKNNLEKEMSSATLYPKIIVTFAVVLGGALTVFVLPQMVPIFGTLDVELPFTTRVLLALSNFITTSGLLFFLIIVFASAFLFFIYRLKPVKTFFYKIFLRIPVVGPLMKDYQLAIITQLMAVLLKSGATISKTLEVVGDSITNFEYKRAMEGISLKISKGTNLYKSVKEYPHLFPGIFVSIVSVGEETGTLTSSFEYLSRFFSAKVKEKTERLPVIIEPILLIAIGFFVALIASAIIMPIYEVTKGLY